MGVDFLGSRSWGVGRGTGEKLVKSGSEGWVYSSAAIGLAIDFLLWSHSDQLNAAVG